MGFVCKAWAKTEFQGDKIVYATEERNSKCEQRLENFFWRQGFIKGSNCQSPAPAARDSTWRDGRCQREKWDSLSVFYGLSVYFKLMICFYTFTKALDQKFDIFSSHWPRFIVSTNHCCSSEFLLQWFSRNQPFICYLPPLMCPVVNL